MVYSNTTGGHVNDLTATVSAFFIQVHFELDYGSLLCKL
jgi:hypothetical protein